MIPPEIQREIDNLERRIRQLEREVASGHARMQSEIRAEIAGMVAGIQAHMDGIVSAALAPLLKRLEKIDQLPDIADDIKALRGAAQEARDYRTAREAREKTIAELQATENVRKTLSDTRLVDAQVAHYPGESVWRRRAPIVAGLAVVAAALVGLFAAMLNSH